MDSKVFPPEGLPEREKALVLSWSSFGLRARGRLREAIQPMKAGLELDVKQKNWEYAAINASNLSELMLTLGEVREAADVARGVSVLPTAAGRILWWK